MPTFQVPSDLKNTKNSNCRLPRKKHRCNKTCNSNTPVNIFPSTASREREKQRRVYVTMSGEKTWIDQAVIINKTSSIKRRGPYRSLCAACASRVAPRSAASFRSSKPGSPAVFGFCPLQKYWNSKVNSFVLLYTEDNWVWGQKMYMRWQIRISFLFPGYFYLDLLNNFEHITFCIRPPNF